MADTRLRIRALLDRWFVVTISAVLVLTLLGGWLAYGAYVDPGTHTEERTVDQWSVEGAFTHQATVTAAGAGTVYEPGTVVENRDAYLQRVMPVLSGTFTVSTTGVDGPVDLRVERRLLVRSVDEEFRSDEKTVYWENETALGTTEKTIAASNPARIPFSVNVTRTRANAQNMSAKLDSPGQIETSIQMVVTATRQVDGATPRTLTATLPVEIASNVYRVTDEPRSESFSRTETVTVPNEYGPLREIGGPFLLSIGILGLGALLGSRYRGAIALTPAERDWLTYRDDRTDFEQWIKTIQLPPEAEDLPSATADTLADLVEFAIDTDNAVLESPDRDAYHVVHDGYRYTFETPPKPAGTSIDPEPDGEVDDGAQPASDGGTRETGTPDDDADENSEA
jgi:hypothetical protein